MKSKDQWRGGGNVISYQPNSLFTNPVCPHPWKLWPRIETTWLSADQPVSAAALWYQEWRVLRGGAGKWPQKPSVTVREWGYLPCSLRWRLISHVACACIHTSVQLHKHTYTHSWCRSLRAEECACVSWGTNEVCLWSIQSTTRRQKQSHNQEPGDRSSLFSRKWHGKAAKCFLLLSF